MIRAGDNRKKIRIRNILISPYWPAMLPSMSWQERDMHVPSGPTNLPYRLFGNYFSHSSTSLDGVDVALRAVLSEVCTSIDADHIAQMVEKLTTDRFRDAMKGFSAALVVENRNAEFWWDYMTMVSILLCSHEQNVTDHGIYTYMLSSVCYHSSSGTTMSITPYGLLSTWLRCRFSR